MGKEVELSAGFALRMIDLSDWRNKSQHFNIDQCILKGKCNLVNVWYGNRWVYPFGDLVIW